MQKTIWKFPLTHGMNAFDVFYDTTVLTIKLDHLGEPMLWAIVDLDTPKRTLRVIGVPTGGNCKGNPEDYIATTIEPDGFVTHWFVWH